MFLTACSPKTVTTTKVEKIKVPDILLEIPQIQYRSVSSQNDAGVLLLDVYEAYDKCTINLRDIKAFQDDTRN